MEVFFDDGLELTEKVKNIDYDLSWLEKEGVSIHKFSADLIKAEISEDKEDIKAENDYKLQGILEATQKHLEDMRRLVFEEKFWRK